MQVNVRLESQMAKLICNALQTADKKNSALQKAYFHVNDEKKLVIVVGNKSEMSSLEIETLTISNYSSCDAFSLSADAIADAISMHNINNDVEFVLSWNSNDVVEILFPNLPIYRRVYSQAAEKVHIEYLEKSKLNTFKTVPVAPFNQMLSGIDDQKPFEAAQIISASETPTIIKIQRDGKIFEKHLDGDNDDLGINLFMDKNSFEKVQRVCSACNNERVVGISSKGNNIALKTSSGVSSFITAGKDEFLQKKIIERETVINFIVDGYLLKKEVSAYVNLHEIKQQEQSLLLFHNGHLMICAISDHLKCAKLLELKDVSLKEFSKIFMANLHEFKKLKVKDITTFHEMKVSVTKTKDGEYNFSFFNETDKTHPFFSVRCIAASERMNEVMHIYTDYQYQLKKLKIN